MPSGFWIGVFRTPVDDVERAAAPALDNSGTIKYVGDDGIPWLGFVRLCQFLGCDAEVKRTGIDDFDVIVVHRDSYGAARYGVVAVAEGVCQGFPRGKSADTTAGLRGPSCLGQPGRRLARGPSGRIRRGAGARRHVPSTGDYLRNPQDG